VDQQHECKAWLQAEGRRAGWLAERLGVHPSLLSHWLAGRRPIPVEQARRIEAMSAGQVKVAAWNCETTSSEP